ncbi:MAG: surface-adhesin E family protein [Rugosibacter sp.]
MVNRLSLAGLIAMSFYAIASHASEWKNIGTDDKGNIWVVDRASIVAEGDIVRSWTRIDFKEQQPYPPNGELIKHVLSVNAVNCNKHQIGVKASRLLRVDGSVITAHEDTDSNIQWQTVAPDTVVEKTMSYVCAYTKSRK